MTDGVSVSTVCCGCATRPSSWSSLLLSVSKEIFKRFVSSAATRVWLGFFICFLEMSWSRACVPYLSYCDLCWGFGSGNLVLLSAWVRSVLPDCGYGLFIQRSAGDCVNAIRIVLKPSPTLVLLAPVARMSSNVIAIWSSRGYLWLLFNRWERL